MQGITESCIIALSNQQKNKMKTKHTQGEWEVSNSQYQSKLFGEHTGFNITANNGQRNVCNVTLNNAVGIPEVEREANAKLIASTPELLEQLESRERLISGFLEKIEEIASSDKSQAKQNEEFMFLIGSYKRTFENALNATRKAIKKATN